MPAQLQELVDRGWNLVILSNCDRDLLAQSLPRLGAPFERVIVAEDVRSYKPAHGHWDAFFAQTGAPRDRYVHVAQSQFHDIVVGRRARPAQRLDQPAGRDGGGRGRPASCPT